MNIENKCTWTFDGYGQYKTSCGHEFGFWTDLETEMSSGFVYCPYCGEEIVNGGEE